MSISKLFKGMKPFSGNDLASDVEAFSDALGVVDDVPVRVVDERFKAYLRNMPEIDFDSAFMAFQKATWPQEAPPLTQKEKRLLLIVVKRIAKEWKAKQS